MVNQVAEVRFVFGARRGRSQTVVLGVEDDRGNGDHWLPGNELFSLLVSGVTGDQTVAVPVGVQHDLDEVRVIERRGGSRELDVAELPLR